MPRTVPLCSCGHHLLSAPPAGTGSWHGGFPKPSPGLLVCGVTAVPGWRVAGLWENWFLVWFPPQIPAASQAGTNQSWERNPLTLLGKAKQMIFLVTLLENAQMWVYKTGQCPGALAVSSGMQTVLYKHWRGRPCCTPSQAHLLSSVKEPKGLAPLPSVARQTWSF